MCASYSEPAFAPDYAVFLDVDGTLIEFASEPSAVMIPEPLLKVIAELNARLDGALALVSGRPIAELDRLFAPLPLPSAGLHGFERRSAMGTRFEHMSEGHKVLEQYLPRLQAFAAGHAGVLVEDKGVAVAVHYRQAPEAETAVFSAAEAVARELQATHVLQRGHMVLEIKPSGRDKGIAIEEFLGEPPFMGRTAIFFGDDVTDEFGFQTVNRHGGLSVKIGSGDTSARWRLPDPDAARRWLSRYAAFLTTGLA